MRIAASLGSNPQDQVLWGIPVLFMTSPNGRIWKSLPAENRVTAPSQTVSPPPQPVRGGVNFGSVGGSVSVGGDIVGGDKITGSVAEAAGPGDDPAARELQRKLQELAQLLSAFFSQLDDDEREDIENNLKDCQETLGNRPLKTTRAVRKLDNVKEILEDAGVGQLVFPIIDSLIEEIRKN